MLELLRRLDRALVEPHVCSLTRGGSLRAQFAEQAKVHDLGLLRAGADPRGLRLLPLLHELRPQLLHARLFAANFWARVCGRLAGLPVLAEERVAELSRPMAIDLIDRAVEPLGSVTVANSRGVFELVQQRGVPASRLRLIGGAVDTDRFRPRPRGEAREKFDVLAVQRLDPAKGVPDLLNAFALLLREHPEATLGICGDGPLRESLDAQIASLGLRGRAVLLGERRDVEELMSGSRVVALASYEEGMPNAVLEAMASARPVVATRVTGSRDAVVDGETGALVAPRDPPALAAALGRYLADPDLARRHGEAGRARAVGEFGFPVQLGRYLALYGELVRGAQ